MITDEAIEELKLRFKSGNSVPVERAFLKQTEFNAIIERLEAAERDAARVNHFETFSESYGFEDMHEGNSWSMHGPYRTFREAIDADIAHIAAEQGNKHE